MMDDQMTEALSEREHEVAAAYVDGQNYKEIARGLGIAPSTVRTHLRTVYRKLGVTSRVQLIQTLDAKADTPNAAPRNDADLIAELSLELDEAVRRERILARVLRIISQQGHSLDAVIDAVLDYTLEICEAEFGILFEYQGDLRYRVQQKRGIPLAFGQWLDAQGVFDVDADTGLGRVATQLTTVNIADVRSENIYHEGAPLRIATADLGKARSFVAIPIMWGDKLIGAFTVYRTRVHPFNERTLEHAQLFADQAAIAFENASRLPGGTAPNEVDVKPDTRNELPLLAVLPFHAIDDRDATARLVGRNLAASLSMELASSPLFRVIDQASSFSPKLGNMSPLVAAENLGARLVVSGSIRALPGGGVRMASALHEVGRPAPIWTDLLTSQDNNTNALFENLLTRLCAGIGTGVERQLLSSARALPSHNSSAIGPFLEGLELHHRHGSGDFQQARSHFETALARDPDFTRARSALAITFVREWFWNSDRSELLDTAETHVRAALSNAPHDPWAQAVSGVIALYGRRHADALGHLNKAMEAAPYDCYVVSRAGLVKFYAGDFDGAIALFERAITLDPLHTDRLRGMLGHCHFHLGQHQRAIEHLTAIDEPLSWELAWLACGQAALGEAGLTATVARYHASVEGSSLHYVPHTRPFRQKVDLERLEAGLRLAGLSER